MCNTSNWTNFESTTILIAESQWMWNEKSLNVLWENIHQFAILKLKRDNLFQNFREIIFFMFVFDAKFKLWNSEIYFDIESKAQLVLPSWMSIWRCVESRFQPTWLPSYILMLNCLSHTLVVFSCKWNIVHCSPSNSIKTHIEYFKFNLFIACNASFSIELIECECVLLIIFVWKFCEIPKFFIRDEFFFCKW